MMRNLKRFGTLFLTLVLALALAVPAFAAVDDTGFSDVDADAWYAEAVMYCREHSLMAGIGNNQFAAANIAAGGTAMLCCGSPSGIL